MTTSFVRRCVACRHPKSGDHKTNSGASHGSPHNGSAIACMSATHPIASLWPAAPAPQDTSQEHHAGKLMQKTFKAHAMTALSNLVPDDKADDLFNSKVATKVAKTVVDDMYELQIFRMEDGYTFVGGSPWGIGEVRFVVKGAFDIVGVPYANVPGASLEAKKTFFQCAADSDLKQVLATGVACQLTVGSMLCIPEACFVASVAGDDGAWGLRWGIERASFSANKVESYITDLVHAMPSLNSTGYRAWADWLATMKG